MNLALRYPLYLIANDRGVLVAKARGQDCVLLFHRKDLAESHIGKAHVIRGLYPLAIPNAETFREGLESLPAGITCAVWDATVAPGAFVCIGMNELFLALSNA